MAAAVARPRAFSMTRTPAQQYRRSRLLDALDLGCSASSLRQRKITERKDAIASKCTLGEQLPEVLWREILDYASLLDLDRCASASRSLQSSSVDASLVGRSTVDVDLHLDGRVLPACAAARCPHLKHLRGATGAVALRAAAGAARPAPLAELETLSLYHQSGAAPGLLRLCTFQLGLGGYARLRFLEITCPTYSDQFGRAARRSAVGNDSALYGFVDAALRQEASGSTPSPPLPSLEDLRLVGWTDLWNLRVHPRREPPLDALVRTHPTLKRLSMPGAPGARHLDRRAGGEDAWRDSLRVNALSGELLPPLRVTCGLCGATLYDRVNACLLGPGTQRHIAFELYVDNEPDPSTTVSGAVTRRTCAKRCHATRNQFLLAGRGGCVSTRGFRWAVACGDGLAVCTDVTTGDVLDADALRKAAVEAVQARGDSDSGEEDGFEGDAARFLGRLRRLTGTQAPRGPRTAGARLLDRISRHMRDLERLIPPEDRRNP